MRRMRYGYSGDYEERIKCYILIDDVFVGEDMLCESYGIELESDGRTSKVRNITVDSRIINKVAAFICSQGTRPEKLLETVESIVGGMLDEL